MEDINHNQDTNAPDMQPEVQDGEAARATGVPTFFELIYGVLFEPVRTFRRVGGALPLAGAAAVFSVVNLALLVSMYISVRNMTGSYAEIGFFSTQDVFDAFLPAVFTSFFIFMYIKWFFYSGLLFLLTELFGGYGKASAVLVVTGLASLPGLVLLPFQVLISLFGGNSLAGFIDYVLSVAFYAWGVVLVVIGIRETQHISTARSVFVVFLPAVSIILIAFVMLIISIAVLSPVLNSMEGVIM